MTRCNDFYIKWQKDPNWCEKDVDAVDRINRYIEICEKFPPLGGLPEASVRPLFKIKDAEQLAEAVRLVEIGAFTPTGGKKPNNRKIVQGIADSFVPPKVRTKKPDVVVPEVVDDMNGFVKVEDKPFNPNNPLLPYVNGGECPDPGAEWMPKFIKAYEGFTHLHHQFPEYCSNEDRLKVKAMAKEVIAHAKRMLEHLGEVETDGRTMNTQFRVIE